MIYAIVVMRGEGSEDTLADALGGRVKPRSIYVVGMTEEVALAAALSDSDIVDIEEPSATELLRFTYAERIGVEHPHVSSYESLLALAHNRLELLTNKQTQGFARALKE